MNSLFQRVSFGGDAELLLIPSDVATTSTTTTTDATAVPPLPNNAMFQQYLRNFTGYLVICPNNQPAAAAAAASREEILIPSSPNETQPENEETPRRRNNFHPPPPPKQPLTHRPTHRNHGGSSTSSSANSQDVEEILQQAAKLMHDDNDDDEEDKKEEEDDDDTATSHVPSQHDATEEHTEETNVSDDDFVKGFDALHPTEIFTIQEYVETTPSMEQQPPPTQHHHDANGFHNGVLPLEKAKSRAVVESKEELQAEADIVSDSDATDSSEVSSQTKQQQGQRRRRSKFLDRAVHLFTPQGRRIPSTKTSTSNLSHQDSDAGGGAEHHSSSASVSSQKSSGRRRGLLESSLSEILQIHAIKKHIPERIRQKRVQQARASRNLTNAAGQVADAALYPTLLHQMCNNEKATLPQLMACLERDKKATFEKDSRGRLPLHVMGDCEGRLGTPAGKKISTAFCLKLLEANPDAIVTADDQGFFPFCSLIAEWLDWIYETHRKEKEAARLANSPNKLPWKSSDENVKSSEILANLFTRGTRGYMTRVRMFPKPEIWDEVEWCLTMLSMALDELGGKSGRLNQSSKREDFVDQYSNDHKLRKPDRMRREVACHLVTILPSIIKCILLIQTEGGETRKRILKLSIFRRTFLCKECIGEWLTFMLRKPGAPSRRAVDFLQMISETKVSDYTGGFRATTVDDVRRFHEERDSVFEAVNELESTMGSLVVLPNRETERAATTNVIWHIMGERLARPFVLGLVLVDLVLHIALMLAFRSNARTQASRLATVPTKTVLIICSHYVIRKFCESVALFSVSPAVLRGYFTSVWTMFDLMAIALTMAAFAWNEKHPGEYRNGFNTFVQGLLWIKVIGLLKVVNKDMSAFILALLEILYDVKNFMIVLVVIIFMFGDMFHLAVSTKDDGEFCLQEGLEGPTVDFCSPDLAVSYLRVYSMLIGDYELSDLQDTTGVTVLYVIFTSMGVVILLNVLIAVVSDSYERATISSNMLFGRARALFVAQNEALEAFLKPGTNPIQLFHNEAAPQASTFFFKICRWLVLIAIVGTAFDTAIFLMWFSFEALVDANETRDARAIPAILIFCLFLILTASLGVLISFALGSTAGNFLPHGIVKLFVGPKRVNEAIVRWMAFYIVGLHSQKERMSKNSADDWSGRMNYIKSIVKEVVQDSQKEIASEIAALETRLYEHDIVKQETSKESGRSKTNISGGSSAQVAVAQS